MKTVETREQALIIIKDLWGMNKYMLNDTIGNGSTNPKDYTTQELIRFANCQIEWHNNESLGN